MSSRRDAPGSSTAAGRRRHPRPDSDTERPAKRRKRDITSEEIEQELIEGYRELLEKDRKTVDATPARLLDMGRKVEEAINERKPKPSMGDLRARLPGPARFDAIWPEEEEARLQADCAALRAYMEQTAPKASNTVFFPMWTKICRLRGCFPPDIVSARNHLCYAEDIELEDGSTAPDPNWTKRFCDGLEKLAIASPCNNNMGLLAFFLRYTVALRKKDARPVPVEGHATDSKFFDILQEEMVTRAGARLDAIHGAAVERCKEFGMEIPWYSRALQQIEKQLVAEDDKEELEPFEGDEWELYRLDVRDLSILIRAFDNVTDDDGDNMFYPVEEKYGRRSKRSIEYKYPSNLEELNELRIPLMVADRRFEEKRRLSNAPRVELPVPIPHSVPETAEAAGFQPFEENENDRDWSVGGRQPSEDDSPNVQQRNGPDAASPDSSPRPPDPPVSLPVGAICGAPLSMRRVEIADGSLFNVAVSQPTDWEHAATHSERFPLTVPHQAMALHKPRATFGSDWSQVLERSGAYIVSDRLYRKQS